jgi:hypothetical protein
MGNGLSAARGFLLRVAHRDWSGRAAVNVEHANFGLAFFSQLNGTLQAFVGGFAKIRRAKNLLEHKVLLCDGFRFVL